MYCKYFGFEQFPFNVTADPEFFYVNAANEELLSALALEVKHGNAFAASIAHHDEPQSGATGATETHEAPTPKPDNQLRRR